MRRLFVVSCTASTLIAATGCPGKDKCVATVDEQVHTVLNVSWDSGKPGTSWVEYGTTQAYGQSTPVVEDESATHEVQLLGLEPLRDYFIRATTEIDGKQQVCETQIRTQGLPSNTPEFTATIYDEDAVSEESYFLGVVQGHPTLTFIIDRDGKWLWYVEGPTDRTLAEAMFARDGKHILMNLFDEDRLEDVGLIWRLDLDGDIVEEIETPMAHHMFTELPDGTISYIAADIREWTNPETDEVESVVGDAIVEIPPGAAPETLFSIWDWRDVSPLIGWDNTFYPQGKDWTHGNALKYLSDSDHLLLSLGHQNVLYEVDRATGEPVKVYGEDPGYAEGSTTMYFQHDPTFLENGNLMAFTTDDVASTSGAIEYTFDENGDMAEVWSAGLDGDLRAGWFGQATRLANGNTLINYGSAGVLREVTPEGEIVWELVVSSGNWFAQVHPVRDLYTGI